MKIRELVSTIAKQEGKKHQAIVGDIREIVGILSDVVYGEARKMKSPKDAKTWVVFDLLKNGERRAERKSAVRKKTRISLRKKSRKKRK